MSKLWIYDWETTISFAEVSFLEFNSDKHVTFQIDDDTGRNDRQQLIDFVKGKMLVGFNNQTFDNIHTNYCIKNKTVKAADLYKISGQIINGQKDQGFNLYKEFKDYLKSDLYESIDLMRLLFSKKLRCSLKELECSLNFKSVREFPHGFDKKLTSSQKEELIAYNLIDCEATKLVFSKSIDALKIRRWMEEEYGIDAFSLDSVNSGVKIIEVLYQKEIGNADFKEQRTFRDKINIKDIILPQVEFKTKAFQDVLQVYKNHTWYSKHFIEELFEDGKLLHEPLINGFKFKFSLGGLHGYTQAGAWKSDDKYDILSIDVISYYPSLIIKHKFCPGHLNSDLFLRIYAGIKEERVRAKAEGNKLKNETLKLSLNGSYGMFGSQYSWLFDHQVRLQICVSGQLFLAMLIERLFENNIQLIDANTDGLFVKVLKTDRALLDKIIKEWEAITLMEMELTKFEEVYFVNTADYIGTTISKGKISFKEKGMFISETQLGKGSEFPIIAKAIREYLFNKIPIEKTIREESNILQFCSYKKLKYGTKCFHNQQKQQRVNRFFAVKSGAYLYAKVVDEETKKVRITNLLKDSPVTILNELDDKKIEDRSINYPFYLNSARTIISAIEGIKELW